ncbi:hypothetical protein [Streptomyces sp. NPDC058486]|uniref:hypothetical protein n=1 Tax=unclassified Streptomyces TaxID=2593676 RepID=UPI00364A675A
MGYRWFAKAASAAAALGAAMVVSVPAPAVAVSEGTVCTGDTEEVYGQDGYVWAKVETCYHVKDQKVYPAARVNCSYKWGGEAGLWYYDKPCNVTMTFKLESLDAKHAIYPDTYLRRSGPSSYDIVGEEGLTCEQAANGVFVGGGFRASMYWDSSTTTDAIGRMNGSYVRTNPCA